MIYQARLPRLAGFADSNCIDPHRLTSTVESQSRQSGDPTDVESLYNPMPSELLSPHVPQESLLRPRHVVLQTHGQESITAINRLIHGGRS
jgi:hypothetical protein